VSRSLNATAIPSCPYSEEDGRNLVAIAIGRHRARLNVEPDWKISEVALRLREVLSYRAEKMVYVKAEMGVSWGEFLELVDHVWPEADVVSIITPQVDLRRRYCLAPSCGACTTLRLFRRR
jgi:hypothetical protein